MNQRNYASFNLYDNFPEENLTLNLFKKICVDRVKLLRYVEDMMNSKDADINQKILSKCNDLNMKIPFNNRIDDEGYLNDNVSHFLLRIAYCKTDENLNWFLIQETRLFSARLHGTSSEPQYNTKELKQMEIDFNMELKFIPEQEWQNEEFKKNVMNGSQRFYNKKQKNLKNSDFYVFPFTEVSRYVSNMQVYIQRGLAYLPKNDLTYIIEQKFKNHLKTQLLKARRFYQEIIAQDQRIAPILNFIPNSYIGKDYSNNFAHAKIGKLKLSDLDAASKQHFPPCMRNMYDKFKQNHHLKHQGRLQLQMFLKSAGLSMDDQLKLWKNEISKKYGLDRFEKEFAYNIRYNYGKEGKGVDFAPMSCNKIIQSINPGHDEHHGCPFKLFSENNLKSLLEKMGIPEEKNKEIVQKAQQKHFQVSCKKTFEFLHPDILAEGVGIHPNSYVDLSMGKVKNKNNKNEDDQNQIEIEK